MSEKLEVNARDALILDSKGKLTDETLAHLVKRKIESYDAFRHAVAHLVDENAWLLSREREAVYVAWFQDYKARKPGFMAQQEAQRQTAPRVETPRASAPAEITPLTPVQSGMGGRVRRVVAVVFGGSALAAAGFALTQADFSLSEGSNTPEELAPEVVVTTPPEAAPVDPEPALVVTPPALVKWTRSSLKWVDTHNKYSELPEKDQQWLADCGAEAVVLVQCKKGMVYVAEAQDFGVLARANRISDSSCMVDTNPDGYKMYDGQPFGGCGGIALVDREDPHSKEWTWDEPLNYRVLREGMPSDTYRKLEEDAMLACIGKDSGVYMAPVVRADTAMPEQCEGKKP